VKSCENLEAILQNLVEGGYRLRFQRDFIYLHSILPSILYLPSKYDGLTKYRIELLRNHTLTAKSPLYFHTLYHHAQRDTNTGFFSAAFGEK
jgi:hypothetical protein